MRKILITGGAGFIGTNIARALLQYDFQVTILDNFSNQIHGLNNSLPSDLNEKVELIIGDVSDKKILYESLQEKEIVIHLAAETGTGQSMYNISHYANINIQSTAYLCDFIINEDHNIKTVVVASSRSIYGEGKYHSPEYGIVYPKNRHHYNSKNNFEVQCPISGNKNLILLPTDEESKIHPSSFYGITKQVQEQMVLLATEIKKINGFALRYQNVYGPGQSLKNPYTGILSIFTRLALKNEPINIFEDGNESRDFVYIDDVVQATLKCIDLKDNLQYALNVGSGYPISVLDVAKEIVRFTGSSSEINISGAFRAGDIRHNFADLQMVKKVLGFEPKWNFRNGLQEFLKWAVTQVDIPENTSDYHQSISELKNKGLFNE